MLKFILKNHTFFLKEKKLLIAKFQNTIVELFNYYFLYTFIL